MPQAQGSGPLFLHLLPTSDPQGSGQKPGIWSLGPQVTDQSSYLHMVTARGQWDVTTRWVGSGASSQPAVATGQLLGWGKVCLLLPTALPSLAHRLEYLQQKQSRANSEAEKQVLEKQAKEAEREVQDIR